MFGNSRTVLLTNVPRRGILLHQIRFGTMSMEEFMECQTNFNGLLNDEETEDALRTIRKIQSNQPRIFNHMPRITTDFSFWHVIIRDSFALSELKDLWLSFDEDVEKGLSKMKGPLSRCEYFTTDEQVIRNIKQLFNLWDHKNLEKTTKSR